MVAAMVYVKAKPVTPPAVAGLVMTGIGKTPVPESETTVGLVAASELMVMAPVSSPTAPGAKMRLKPHELPGNIVIGEPALGVPPTEDPKPQ